MQAEEVALQTKETFEVVQRIIRLIPDIQVKISTATASAYGIISLFETTSTLEDTIALGLQGSLTKVQEAFEELEILVNKLIKPYLLEVVRQNQAKVQQKQES